MAAGLRYDSPLVPARLVRRYKRFFADCELDDGTPVTAHLANTGKMTGCWKAGAPCRLSRSTDPKRKLAWSVEQTCIDGRWILVNTARPNRIVEEALRAGRLGAAGAIRAEARYPEGLHGRADFRLDAFDGRPGTTWLEVKNATLREGETVWFPDTVTVRGAKHLDTLSALLDRGDHAVLLLHVGTEGGSRVQVARHLDPAFGAALDRAVEKGLRVLAWQVCLSDTDAVLHAPLPFIPSATPVR